MEEKHWLSCAAYVELNPVKAKIVEKPWDYKWSSVHAYLSDHSDGYVNIEPLRSMVKDWKQFLTDQMNETVPLLFEAHERTGRPLGEEAFVKKVCRILGRDLVPKKPGPKPKK